MFSEPLTITIDGAAQSFVRTAFTPNGLFQTSNGDLTLVLGQSVAKANDRFNVRLTRQLFAADAVNPAIQRLYKRSYWFGSSGPMNGVGLTDAQALKDMAGFLAWLANAGTQSKLMAGES